MWCIGEHLNFFRTNCKKNHSKNHLHVEGKKYFALSYKFWPIYLDLVVKMFVQKFFTLYTFPFVVTTSLWIVAKSRHGTKGFKQPKIFKSQLFMQYVIRVFLLWCLQYLFLVDLVSMRLKVYAIYICAQFEFHWSSISFFNFFFGKQSLTIVGKVFKIGIQFLFP
jgi:hypothetical protein